MDRSVFVTLGLRNQQFLAGIAQSAAATRSLAGRLEGFSKKHEADFARVGQASLAMGAALGVGMGLATKAAIDWQSQWAGVTKVTEGTATQMAQLESELRGLAKTLPASHAEIAKVAEAAGQLGIKRQDVAAFTKVMIDLAATTNLTADDAATAIARISNIMQIAPADVDRFGAALVALGNDGASTEREIVEMATRIASAGTQIGLTGSDVLAFANALSSVGIEAEAGGSAISRVMLDMRNAVMSGGAALETFATTAGMSSEQFVASFRDDAGLAVVSFVEGLGAMEKQGKNSNDVLSDLGLTDIRVGNALRSAASAGDLFRDSLRTGSTAWEENTALVNEANKRYETSAAKIQVAKNNLNDFAIDIGGFVLPAVAGLAAGVTDLAQVLGGLPEPVKGAMAALGVLGAAVTLTGGGALLVIPKIAAMKESLEVLGFTSERASKSMGRFAAVAKGAGIAIGLVAIYTAADALGSKLNSVEPTVGNFTEALMELAQTGESVALSAAFGDDLSNLRDELDRVSDPSLLNRLEDIGNWLSPLDRALGSGSDAADQAAEDVKAMSSALAEMVNAGHADLAAGALDQLNLSVDEARRLFPEYDAALLNADGGQKLAAESAYKVADAVGGVTEATGSAYDSLGSYASSLSLSEDATKALVEQIEAWGSALADFVQPLGAYTDLLAEKETAERTSAEATAAATESSTDSWEDYAGAVSVSVSEYLSELERQVEAQEKHADNMTRLAGRVSQGTLDELARMGPEGAPLVAELVNASDEQLGKMDDLFARRTSDATGAMAGELYLANVLLPRIAAKVGEDTAVALATALANGTTTVGRIAKDYAHVLEAGVNPILQAIGSYPIAGRGGRRGGLTEFADGGFEEHVAQIAPAGAMRLWAEPETGGEAYIPLAPAKRQRSLSIWRETGRRLQAFAAGGFTQSSDVPRPSSTAPYGPPLSTAGDGTMNVAYAEAVEFIKRNSLAGAGNLVELGRKLQQMGFRVSGHAAFGGTPTSGHAPGSYHYRNRAIDVNYGAGGQHPAEMAAIDALMPKLAGMKFAEKIWRAPGHFDHLHLAMAKGGILNPHVRDQGGPLLPGLTYNGTGAPEMVLPLKAGGILNPLTRNATLAGDAGRLAASGGTVAEIRALVEAWEAYNDAVEQAARRTELVTAARVAERELAVARTKGTEAETKALHTLNAARLRLANAKSDSAKESAALAVAEAQRKLAVVSTTQLAQAQEKVNDARTALRDFDAAAKAAAEKRAVDALVESIEAETEAREKAAQAAEDAADAQRSVEDNMFTVGAVGTAERIAQLDQRLAAEERYSDAWTALWQERKRLLDGEVDAHREAAEELVDLRQRAVDAATKTQDQALDDLNRMLDQEQSIRDRQAAAADAYATKAVQIGQRVADAEKAFAQQSLAAAQSLRAEQDRLLDARRSQLESWARLDQVAGASWGNTVEQLLTNARAQARDFQSWMDELATARARGVSEQVIGAYGLGEGPQALGQLRQFNAATVEEIADLNAEVTRRTELAGEQTAREQRAGYGALGRDLLAAQQQYADSIADLQARFREAQAQAADDLEQAQADLLVAQTELALELAAIGQEQGRSYVAAITAGMDSELPALRAKAAEVQAAIGTLSAAQAELATAQAAAAVVATPVAAAASSGAATLGLGRSPASLGQWPGLADPTAAPGTVMYGVPKGGSYLPAPPVPQPVQLTSHTYVTLDGEVIDHQVEKKLLHQGGAAFAHGVRE